MKVRQRPNPPVKRRADSVQLVCPYCCWEERAAPPEWLDGSPAREAQCLPYTRDVGKFDHQRWTRVGSDFIRLLGWERIGILRQEPGASFTVAYKVQRCARCRQDYDVYLNATEKKPLAEIWPHLFGPARGEPGQIRHYRGISWPVWLLRRAAVLFGSPGQAAPVLAIVLAVLGLLPWLLQLPWLAGSPQGWSGLIPDAATKIIAAAGLAWILVLFERFVTLLQDKADFEGLFAVADGRGVRFWRNYTLCRLVGVQEEGSRTPRLSQVEIVGGGAAVLSLWVIWFFAHFHWTSALAALVGAALLGAARLALGAWGRGRRARGRSARGLGALKAALVLAAPTALAAWIFLSAPSRWEAFRLLADLGFWTVFAFCVGIGAWASMNSALYILQGARRIPMNLSPYDRFEQVQPLLDIRKFSTRMMGALFITMVGIVSALVVFSQELAVGQARLDGSEIGWLSLWMQFALSILFAAVAIGVRPRFFLVAALFVALEVAFLFSNSRAALPNTPLVIDFALLTLGAFLTFINLYHGRESMAVITALLAGARKKALREIDDQVSLLRGHARESLPVQDGQGCTDKSRLIEYTQAVQGLEALIGLRKEVEKVEHQPKAFVTSQVFPFILSFFLPTLWDVSLEWFLYSVLEQLKMT